MALAAIAMVLVIPAAVPVSATSNGLPEINTVAATAKVNNLTADEEYWLTYMREEEKLARDVYLYLNDIWQLRSFDNISRSEQKHMDSVKSLLDSYGIADPAADKEKGEFTNPDLQALYNELIEQGSISLIEAIKVGILIEETDIDDLKEAISLTNNDDIKTVYSNLLRGSQNHLKAFTSNLSKHS